MALIEDFGYLGVLVLAAACLVGLWALWSAVASVVRSIRPAPGGEDGGREGAPPAPERTDLLGEEIIAITVQAGGRPLLFGQLEEYLTDESRALGSRFEEDDTFLVLDKDKNSLFRVVNADEEGRFDAEIELDAELEGVHLFLEPGGDGRDLEALDAMVQAADWLAAACGGRRLDSDGNPLSDQAIGHLRSRTRRAVRQGNQAR